MERVTEAALQRQRTIQTALLFIILATLPCYCLGAVLLLTSPTQRAGRTPTVEVSATVIGNPTNTPFPSITPFQLPTIVPSPVGPLLPTPTQIILGFPTARPTLTFTPFFPSQTPIVLPSITPIIIIPPTVTPRPTSTPFSLPTNTPIIILPPTATPLIPPLRTPTPSPGFQKITVTP